MRTLPVVALLALTAGLSAQVPTKAPAQPTEPPTAAVTALQSNVIIINDANGANCPVSARVSRLPEGGMLEAAPGGHRKAQALHLSFTTTSPRSIVGADVTLHGMAGQHLIPASGNPSAYASENFSLSPRAGNDSRFTSVVYMRKLTNVDYVEINAITFADGTRWHSSEDSTCRVVPNGFQLVAGR